MVRFLALHDDYSLHANSALSVSIVAQTCQFGRLYVRRRVRRLAMIITDTLADAITKISATPPSSTRIGKYHEFPSRAVAVLTRGILFFLYNRGLAFLSVY